MFLELKKYELRFLSDGKPVLIDREADINVDDVFYLNGAMRKCKEKPFSETFDDGGFEFTCIIDEMGKELLAEWVYKVVATPEQIGYSINFGPPHDRNYDWKYDDENKRYVYLEEYISSIWDDFKEGDQVTVVVEEVCPHYNGAHIGKDCSCKSGFIVRPKLHQGKIIMDGYKILGEKEGYYFH